VRQHQKLTFALLAAVVAALALTACASSNPIDTSNPTAFQHRIGVFSLQVPKAWKAVQDEVDTEAVAAFIDPTQRAELQAYTGLLERRFTDEEGQRAISALITNLLGGPADLTLSEVQRQADGSFSTTLSFTRNNEKQAGVAIFRDTDLALSGVILSGPQAGWAEFETAMQPYLDSFAVNAEGVQGTFFKELLQTDYALAVPAGWSSPPGPDANKIRSPNGQMHIVASSMPETNALDTAGLSEAGRQLLQRTLGAGKVTSTERLADGRVKVLIDRGDKQTVGYLDQKDGAVIGLYFDVPAGRVQDYQPFIDFIYSTYITGKA
jgi:hypothetical protein